MKRRSVDDAWSNHPDLGAPIQLTPPDKESKKDESKNTITAARNLLEEKKRSIETAAEAVLGRALQLASKQDEEAMLNQLGGAGDLLTTAALNGLPTRRLGLDLRQ